MNKHGKIITFGEVIMRLNPPLKLKMQQAQQLDFTFGGTEFNVGASLANFGHEVTHVTALSTDFVGDAALRFVKSMGVNPDHVARNEHPLGQYFLEEGMGMRPGQVAYNRLHGAFANLNPAVYDWDMILQGADIFHWTGITPGISENALVALKEALAVAKEKKVQITFDPTYRSNLWQYGQDGQEVLKDLAGQSHILLGSVSEINKLIDTDYPKTEEGFKLAATELLKKMPNIKKVFGKVRADKSATSHAISGHAFNGEYLYEDTITITDIVDRIGTGDAFAAGVIHGLLTQDDAFALKFGLAACAIKHTIPRDINLAKANEIEEIMNGNLKGRLKR
ncbi:MAG: 2-dehydro-3-deoxygluconokinase [Cytophagaceae bacterium]|nr:2-dehydro-3-deoxygluconokinase [Cytophagaceae bacterium]|tara:strand:- start:1285 stop:2295 length:1011 start_codon:yes stop_codon:yes gene_type:complete